MAEIDFEDGEEERRRPPVPDPSDPPVLAPGPYAPDPNERPPAPPAPSVTGAPSGLGGGYSIDWSNPYISQAQGLGIPRERIERFLAPGAGNEGDYDRLIEALGPDEGGRVYPRANRAFQSGDPRFRNEGGPSDNVRNAMGAAQAGGAGRTTWTGHFPGDQFSDPYTKALEDLIKQQLAALEQPQTNPALDQLLAFLDTRFKDLSTSPGYSAAEQGLLRTQALEPIEQDRAAAQRRSLERTAARGFLPSSGLAELDSREEDYRYDRLRGEAQRDLGLNAINKRNQDQALALTLGQLSGVQIPGIQRAEDQMRRNESIALAQMLYNLPRQAMMDNLAVIQGSPMPGSLFGDSVSLMRTLEAQRQYNQERSDARSAALADAIGRILDSLGRRE